MAREIRKIEFFEKHDFMFSMLKLSVIGIVVWFFVLVATSFLSVEKYKQQVKSFSTKNRLEYVFNNKINCLREKSNWSCIPTIGNAFPVSDRAYSLATATQLLLEKSLVIAKDGSKDAENKVCEWIKRKVPTTPACQKGFRLPTVSLEELDADINRVANWYSAESVIKAENNIKYNCVAQELSGVEDIKTCVSELAIYLVEENITSGPVTFISDFHQAVLKESELLAETKDFDDYVKARWAPKSVVQKSLDYNFVKMILNSMVLLLIMLSGIWTVLIMMASAQMISKKFGLSALMFFSLPPFVVALLFSWMVDFDPLHTANTIKLVLVGIVGIVAGGITFDVGRRLLILVDEEMNSPVIRGLEHFGLHYHRNPGFFSILQITAAHLYITACDVTGLNSHGLEKEKNLEHFVIRSVEYRLIEYFGVRTSYVVDNLIILGIIFSSVGLVSNVFKNMVTEDNPLLVLQGVTAMIIIAILLRWVVGFIHWRLFPNYRK